MRLETGQGLSFLGTRYVPKGGEVVGHFSVPRNDQTCVKVTSQTFAFLITKKLDMADHRLGPRNQHCEPASILLDIVEREFLDLVVVSWQSGNVLLGTVSVLTSR